MSAPLAPPPLPAHISKGKEKEKAMAKQKEEPKYGGFSRFEIELEFVQALANPVYLNHLAASKLLSQPSFIAYLDYLQYWMRPPYSKYLIYPGPTLRNLELLQLEKFRQDIISPELVQAMIQAGMRSAVEWHHVKKQSPAPPKAPAASAPSEPPAAPQAPLAPPAAKPAKSKTKTARFATQQQQKPQQPKQQQPKPQQPKQQQPKQQLQKQQQQKK